MGTLTLERYLSYNARNKGDFPNDLVVRLGGEYIHKNGKKGVLIGFDFDENDIQIYIGDGFYWNGTGGEFLYSWKSLFNEEQSQTE